MPTAPPFWMRNRSNPASTVRSKVMSITRLVMMLIVLLWELDITQPGRVGFHSERSCR